MTMNCTNVIMEEDDTAYDEVTTYDELAKLRDDIAGIGM